MSRKLEKILLDYDAHCRELDRTTTVRSNETIAQRAKRIRDLEANYGEWFEYYFPSFAKVKCASFHIKLANFIIKNKRCRVLAEWYRSAAKSVHVNMGIPLFLYLARNDLKFMLLIGENERKAKKLLSSIQAQLKFNQRIKGDYGEKFQSGDWAEGDFLTTDGVRFMSLGFGQDPRGAREDAERPDYISTDDTDNRKHFNNDRIMRESVDYITEDVWGCFDSSDNSVERYVHANNNTHKNSITNRLKTYFLQAKRQAKEEGIEDIFHVSSVKAVSDLNTFKPTWPSKTSADYWRKRFNRTPYRSFMREFMHVHIQDGAVFRFEDIRHGEMLRLDKYDGLMFYGDLSYKDAGDYKAMVLVGKTGRKYHIIYVYLRQGSRIRCAQWLYDLYEDKKLEKFNIRYMIEGLFAMDEFTSDFDTEGDKRGYHIPVLADKRSKVDKFDRIESLTGFFERGDVLFNGKERDSNDQTTLIDQFLSFEKGSDAHDDGPDAVHGAVSNLNRVTFVEKFPAQLVSRAQLRDKSKNRY